MTKEFEALMRLVGAAALGKPVAALPTDLDWQKIEQLAGEQSVQTLVGYALRLSPEAGCPQEIRTRLIADMRQAAFSNNAWKSAVLGLLAEMNAAGIPALLIKGYAVADCYAAPDCRLSGDTDLLIDPKNEKRACKFMKAKGFKVDPRWENGHHAVCHHPQYGCVELHVMLYDEIVEDVWFSKMDGNEFVSEPYIDVHTADGAYRTLGYTDHMIFLMLHLIKHFIEAGMSLKMMLDTALFFAKYAEQIDSKRFWRTMADLKYGTVAQSILWATVRYCGVPAEMIPGLVGVCPEQVDMLVTDLEEGGWLGRKDQHAREEGWHEYNRQLLMENKSKAQYWLYMLRWKLGMYWKALFPTFDALAAKYPYIRKCPLLTPWAWLHRLIFRGSKAVKNGALTSYMVIDEEKVSAVGKERVRMFRSLDMLD